MPIICLLNLLCEDDSHSARSLICLPMQQVSAQPGDGQLCGALQPAQGSI